jgi:hypothetical protein
MATKKHSMKKSKSMKKMMSSNDIVGQTVWCLQCKKHVKVVSGEIVKMKNSKRSGAARIAGKDAAGHKVSKIIMG